MAPRGVRKLKTKSNPNKSQQIDHTTKHASSDSIILRGIRGLFDKTNVASDGGKSSTENGALVTTETQNASSKGSEPSTTNQTSESDNITQNTAAPSTQSPEIPSTESLQDPSPEANCITATAATGSKKRGRGQTMGKGIMKAFVASGNKMKINVDPLIGRPINGDESAKLSSQIGIVTRDVLPVPKRWKEIDEENGLGPGFDHIKIHMDVNVDAPGMRQCLIDKLKSSSRQKRYKLHKHFQKFANLQEAKNNKPTFYPSKQNWETLCKYFATEKFKHTSSVNSGNRKKLRAPHISGRKHFIVRRHEISQKELNGDPCDRIELYKRTHYSEKNGWSSDEAEQNWELMIKKQEQYKEEEIEKSTDEIVLEVLGHGSGYIKGLGYGPKPPSRSTKSYDSATQQLQKELQETQQKLQMSESQVKDLKTQVVEFENEVTDLKNQLGQQGVNVNKLMAYMAAKGIDL